MALLILGPVVAGAQRVPGVGSDAVVLPSGTLRVSVDGRLESWSSRFESDPAGSPLAERVPLGTELGGVEIGSDRIGALMPVESRVRSMTGMEDFRLSIGDVRIRAEARRSTIPIRAELGIGRRLQLSAMVPYVETQVMMAAAVNASAEGGWNVGVNPALQKADAASQNAALVGQLRAAAGSLETALAGCSEGSTSPVCADPGGARATGQATIALADDIAELYGLPDQQGAPVVPRAGSAAASALSGRIAGLRSTYAAFGIGGIAEGAMPAGAGQPLTAATFPDMLGALGIALPRNVTRYGIGDVELGARVLLVDGFAGDAARASVPSGFAMRASLDGLVRLGTGQPPDPDRLLDVGTGDGQTDVELGVVGDVLLGRRFWASAALRYGVQLAGERTIRLPSAPGESYLTASDAERVTFDPGDYMELELTPRLSVGDFVSLAAQYRFRRSGADVVERSAGGAEGSAAALDWLGRTAEGSEHRLGVGLTLSTMSAYVAGRVRTPLDVSYLHSQTVAGSGRATVRSATDQVTVRAYLGIFGRRR